MNNEQQSPERPTTADLRPFLAKTPERSSGQPGLVTRAFRLLAEIVVGLFLVLDLLVTPLFRPIVRWLSSLRVIHRLEHWIGSLHPYLILVLLVVPFGIAEITKVYAVILMAEEHFRIGMTMFIGAYVVSILVCERTFHAGKGQLMKIGWFAVIWTWLMGIRDSVMGWFRSTWAWRVGVDVKERVRMMFSRGWDRLRALFAPKPKDALGRR